MKSELDRSVGLKNLAIYLILPKCHCINKYWLPVGKKGTHNFNILNINNRNKCFLSVLTIVRQRIGIMSVPNKLLLLITAIKIGYISLNLSLYG